MILLPIGFGYFKYFNDVHGPTEVLGSKIGAISTAFAYTVNVVIMSWADKHLNKWKRNELSHLGYRWNCRDDGLFLVFLLVQVFMLIVSIFIAFFTCKCPSILVG